MRSFRQIIESVTPPPTDCLWIYGTDIKYFTNGRWKSLIGDLKSTGEDADRQELEEKVDSLDKEIGQIKTDLSVFGSEQGVVELEIGDSAEVKKTNLAKLKTVQSTDHTFFTDINYGYGTADWLPNVGGNAFIITNEGHAVKYTITDDGAVFKTDEITLGNTVKGGDNGYDGLMSKADKDKLDSLIQIPSGGKVGQILERTSNGVQWANSTSGALATKTSPGVIKAITNIVNLNENASTAQVVGVVNTLLEQFRNCGLIVQ